MTTTEKMTVTIKGDGAGNVVVKSKNNPQYGYIRVAQDRFDFEDGFVKDRNVSALIPGEIDTLLKLNWKENQEIEGKVYVKEQLKPFNVNDPDRDLKVAGDTGVICTLNNQPIYRKQFFSKNVNIEDTRVFHDNVDEIKEAYARIKAEKEASDLIANDSEVGSM